VVFSVVVVVVVVVVAVVVVVVVVVVVHLLIYSRMFLILRHYDLRTSTCMQDTDRRRKHSLSLRLSWLSQTRVAIRFLFAGCYSGGSVSGP
jgi:hypothetical protein